MTVAHLSSAGMNARLVYVVGPSGAGKDSLLQWLLQNPPMSARGSGLGPAAHLHLARRTVTRSSAALAVMGDQPDALEEVVSEDDFAALVAADALAMHWQANGLSYGVRHTQLAPLATSDWVLMSGSRAHLPQAMRQFPGLCAVHVLANPAVLRGRLLARARESIEAIDARLQRAMAYQPPLGALCIHNDHSLQAAGEQLWAHLFSADFARSASPAADPEPRRADADSDSDASLGRSTQSAGAAQVLAVHRQTRHVFSKEPVPDIELVAGHGVRGDAHFGTTVKHRSRVARDPFAPNLRQVHLLHQELLDALSDAGLPVRPGQLGENITTQGLNLLALPVGTRLRVGQAVLELTGLRNPCAQMERFRPGLLAAVTPRGADGTVARLAGVMAVVCEGGVLRPGDPIGVVHWPPEHRHLEPV